MGVYVPASYNANDASKCYPVLLFLHGMGECGTNLNKVKVHGPPKMIENGKDFNFIVVSPQLLGGHWDPALLTLLVDRIYSDYHADEKRLYVTGLSRGGTGTWELASVLSNRI